MEPLNVSGGLNVQSLHIIPEIQSFCEDLKQLKNVYLVSDIANRINKIVFTFTCSNLVPEIKAVFMGLFAPHTVMDKIKHLARQLDQNVGLEKGGEKQSMKRKNIQDDLHQIAQNLLTWIKEQEKNSLYTKEVKILLDIPKLKMCDNEMIEEILRIITTSSNETVLKEKIEKICENFNLQDHFNAHSWKYDLATLCDEIIAQKLEQKSGGFASQLENKLSFFYEKKITILPEEKGDAVEGRIESAKEYSGKYVFTLNNSTLIEIEKTSYKVEILTPKSFKLISMIRTQSIRRGEVIDLPNDVLLKRGSYKIESYEEEEGHAGLKQIIPDQMKSALPEIAREYIDAGFQLVKLKGIESSERGKIIVNNDNKTVVVVKDGFRMDHKYSDIEKTEVITKVRTSVQHIIDAETLNQYVKLSDPEENIQEKNEDLTRQINEIFEEEISLLDLLVEGFIRESFNSIQLEDLEFSKRILIQQKLEQIVALSRRLGEEVTLESKLISIVQNFIYKMIAKDEDKLEIANIMKILMEGNKHIEEINNKTIIQIWGFTGAGKSTVVNHFLGFDLESTKIAGELPKFQLKKEEDAKKGATIGLSDGCSETLYPHAYILKDGKVIVDYPGFRDTRGATMHLCSSICTDEAVLRAKALQGIVAVVPMIYFLGEDKYEKLIELIDNLLERFPNAFSENKKGTPPIYLLITKKDKVPDNFWNDIAKGSQFQKLINETNALLDKLGPNQLTEYYALSHRLKVWKIIASLFEERIDVVNYSNKKRRDILMEKYSKSTPILREDLIYKKSIQKGSVIHQKFQDTIHSYASTWTDLILKPYLQEIPDKIKLLKEQIDVATKAVEKAKLLKEKLPKEKLEKNIEKKDKEEEWNRIKSGEVPDSFFEEELNIDFSTHRSTIKAYEHDIRLYEEQIKPIEDLIGVHKTNIQKNQTANKEKSEQSSALEQENSLLAQGVVEVKLDVGKSANGVQVLRDLKIGDKMQVFNVSDKQEKELREAHNRSQSLNIIPTKTREHIVGKFKEKLFYPYVIEKEYMIAPVGTDLIKKFEKEGKAGEYEAEIRGVGICKATLDRKVPHGSQKVSYWIELEWKDDSKQENIPWFEIVHIIPKAQYHKKQIETNQTKIDKLQKEIQENNTSIAQEEESIKKLTDQNKIAENKIEEAKQYIACVYELIEAVKAAKKDEKKKLYLSSLIKMIEKLEEEIQVFPFKEEQLKDEIESQEKMLNSLQEKLKAQEKKQALYALLIRTQWNKAQLMRKFINNYVTNEEELDTGQNGDAITRNNNLTIVCEEFNTIYDQQEQSLIGNVESTLRHADCSGLCSSFLAYSKQTEKLNRPKKEILLPHRSTTERQSVYISKRTGLADDAQIE